MKKQNKSIKMSDKLVMTKKKEKSYAPETKEISDYWKEKGLLENKHELDRLEIIVKKALTISNIEEIKQSIDNYVTVIKDETYFINYEFSLMKFLHFVNRHFLKYTEEGEHWVNYKKKRLNKQEPLKLEDEKDYNIKEPGIDGYYKKSLEQLRGLTYKTYLLTDHWQHFSKEAMKWANNQCQLCNDKGLIKHVHHKNYDNLGRETFNDVIVLCAPCHRLVHGIEVE